MNRLWIEPERKLRWLRITISVNGIIAFALSWRLWVSSRLFPLIPISDLLSSIPFPLDYVLFFALLGILLAIIAINNPSKIVLTFVILTGLLTLWDQMRLQPWVYQYLFMLAAIGLFGRKESASDERERALNCCRLVLIATYVWSGAQKLNINFARKIWPDLAGPALSHLPHAVRTLPPITALVLPMLEIGIGVGLMTRRFRNLSVVLAILMHIIILSMLVVSRENMVVWPWNIAMIGFNLILFWRDRETGPGSFFVVRSWFQGAVLISFGVLPALSFFGLWDSYLSCALYSGNTDEGVVYVSSPVIGQLPAALRPYIWQIDQPFFLDINRWAYGELNVPVYPEPRVYRRAAEEICVYARDSLDVQLRIYQRPNPLTGARKSEYLNCTQLGGIPRD